MSTFVRERALQSWILSLCYSSFAYSFLTLLPTRRYASTSNSYRNVSVRLSVCLSSWGSCPSCPWENVC